jgi:hypothetical protein
MFIEENKNTYFYKSKEMLEEGKSPEEVILYLAVVIDTLIASNDLDCPLKHLSKV